MNCSALQDYFIGKIILMKLLYIFNAFGIQRINQKSIVTNPRANCWEVSLPYFFEIKNVSEHVFSSESPNPLMQPVVKSSPNVKVTLDEF